MVHLRSTPCGWSCPGRGGPGETLKSVKEQLRQVPDKGIGYGLLRYLHPDAALRDSLRADDAAISFNYLGQFDQVLAAGCRAPPGRRIDRPRL